MRSRTADGAPGRCPRCFLKSELCLCSSLPRVETSFELRVLRHLREASKSSNTARVAALALPRLTLTDYNPHTDEHARALLGLEGAWLLFPGEPRAPFPQERPRVLVALDGTWREVRRMLHRMPALDGLPRLSLSPPRRERLRARRPPEGEQMSTLEALAAAVALLDGAEKAAPLERLHDALVLRMLVGRGTLPRRALSEGP